MSSFPILRDVASGGYRPLAGMDMVTEILFDAIGESIKALPSLWSLDGLFANAHGQEIEPDTIPCKPPFSTIWLEGKDGEGNRTGVLFNENPTSNMCTAYTFLSRTADGRHPILIPIQAELVFNDSGTLESIRRTGANEWPGTSIGDAADINARAIAVSLQAFMFSHCKNVKLVERLPKRHEQREAKRKGEPALKFHEIVIDPGKTKQVAIGAGSPSQDHPTKALHIARGHFATYTEDRPLFGKYTGTFWRPAHVRGSADVGTVKSTYRVKAS